MRLVVLVKTVRPLTALAGTISPAVGSRIATEPGEHVINPFDEFAIEEALRIKDKTPSCHVKVVSLGGPEAEIGLRRGLALGADRAMHVLCENADDWDSWATAMALAQTLRRHEFDLALCGAESLDRHAGLVGPFLAEMLKLPHMSRIAKIQELTDQAIVIERRLERGDREILECRLPALITVDKGTNRPRLPAFQAIVRARKQPIELIATAQQEGASSRLGRSSNLTEIVRVSTAKPKRGTASQVGGAVTTAERRSLMMKGGGTKPTRDASHLEGTSDAVLTEFERLLREQGIDFHIECEREDRSSSG